MQRVWMATLSFLFCLKQKTQAQKCKNRLNYVFFNQLTTQLQWQSCITSKTIIMLHYFVGFQFMDKEKPRSPSHINFLLLHLGWSIHSQQSLKQRQHWYHAIYFSWNLHSIITSQTCYLRQCYVSQTQQLDLLKA